MKTLFHYTVLVLGTLSLIGCSYFETEEDLNLSNEPPPVEKIDLTKQGFDRDIDTALQEEPVNLMTIDNSVEARQAILHESEGSVEIFPVDGSLAPYSGPVSAGAHSYGDAQEIGSVSAIPVQGFPSAVYSGDPSVEVFPLDRPLPPTAAGLPPAAPVTGMNIVNESTGSAVTVYFAHDSTTLDGSDKQKLADVAKTAPVSVEGYASAESSIADPVQRKIANLKVSMERAFSVARALIEDGMPAELLTTVAHGENDLAATAEESRRVEIRGL